jgi:hypothetical protein
MSHAFIFAFAFSSQSFSGAASLSEPSTTSNGESSNFDCPMRNFLSVSSLSKSKLPNTFFFVAYFF